VGLLVACDPDQGGDPPWDRQKNLLDLGF